MANHARVEELSDSDPEEMDISDVDEPPRASSMMNPADIPSQARTPAPPRPVDMETAKHWQCLYPVYFDSTRTRAEGRRVGKEAATPNPLAREICEAVFSLGLQITLEAGKTHPKDWANPGRVRVLVKENGQNVNRNVKNKHDLFKKVAEWLKSHPTTENTPMKLKIQGMPPMNGPPPAPAIPRGWKMSNILPLHSAAISGGGVSENLFKDMMAEMSGQGGASGSNEPSGGSNKPKKKVKG